MRRIDVADVGETVLADTVGFIRHLPHDLVAAFKATLQETRQATLLLHVIDAADVRVQENIEAVNTVLEEIDAHEIPTLLVMNKIDMLEDFEPRIDRDEENKPIRVWLFFRTDRSGDTTAFSGFDGAAFRRGGAAYIASATAGRASEKSFLSASGNRKRVDGGGRQRKSASSYADR